MKRSFLICILTTSLSLPTNIMGISLFGFSSNTDYVSPTGQILDVAPNPSPYKFTIESIEHHNGNTIVLARYDGCTTFNGFKLMLLRGEFSLFTKLDPHILGNDHPVVARFEPTETGYNLAILCANEL